MANSIIFPSDTETGIGWEPVITVRTTLAPVSVDISVQEGPARPATIVVENGSGIGGLTAQAATGGGNDYIDNALAAWTVNGYQDGIVTITSGLGAGQSRKILNQLLAGNGNTATRIYVSEDWDTNPDGTSVFDVISGWSVASIQKDSGQYDYFMQKLSPLVSSSATTYTVEIPAGGVGADTFTFTTATVSQRPTLEDQYNRTLSDGTTENGTARVHPLAELGATIRPPSGMAIKQSSIVVELDGKRYINRGQAWHPKATIAEVYNPTTTGYDWVFTIEPTAGVAQRGLRSCDVRCETEGGVPIDSPWTWEVDVAGEFPRGAYRAASSMADGWDRDIRPQQITFSGGFTNASSDITISDSDRWEAVEEGQTIQIDGETATYTVGGKTAPDQVALTAPYAGTTGTKACRAFWDQRAHLALLTAMGEELAVVEENLDAVNAANSVLDCEPTDLPEASRNRGIKPPMGLGIDPEQVRAAVWARLRFPDGVPGAIVGGVHALTQRPTYSETFVPEKHVKVYGQNVTVIAQETQCIINPDSTIVERSAAGTGVWTSRATGRDPQPGDWIRYYSTSPSNFTGETQIKDVYLDGGTEYLELWSAIPSSVVGPHTCYYQVTDRRWPSTVTRLGTNKATFTQNLKRVTSTGGFDNLSAGWSIMAIDAGRTGKWYRVETIISDTELDLVDHFAETTAAAVNWIAEADDRAGWTDRTRIVAESGESASFTAGSTTVTGTATTWNTVDARDRLFAGMRIGPNYGLKELALTGNVVYGLWAVIESVDSDTQITLTQAAPRTINTGYRAEWDDPAVLSVAVEVPRGAQFQALEGGGFVLSGNEWGPISEGTATFTNGSSTVVGVGTNWTSDVQPGDLISPTGVTDTYGNATYVIVDSVTDDTNLELVTNWNLSTKAGYAFTLIRPLYGSDVGLFGLSTLLLSTAAVAECEKAMAAGLGIIARIVPDPA